VRLAVFERRDGQVEGRESCHTVVVDTNVLINLLQVNRLDLLAQIPEYVFVVPEDVVKEVTYPDQARCLKAAVARGDVRRDTVESDERSDYAELCQTVGKGEAACLAIAKARGWLVATDEVGRVRRWSRENLGQGRMINTPGLLVLAINNGVLTVEEADQIKAALERRRFRMTFASFKDVLGGLW
jgi:predicted nucleic acid-binding protein